MSIEVASIEPFGLAGSGGSSPMRLRRADPPGGYLFGKLYARSHVRADRWYKLGRQLRYGRLEDEQSFKGVRRLVQQEDYALRLCRDAGLPGPEPFGFVELTPEREYLLLTEFFAGSAELGEATVDDTVIDDGLLIVRRMWDAGLAHRDIKPVNLLVRDGRLLLIDVAFAEVRPTPWRQAVDLANMMLCLALRSTAERVYQRAPQFFTAAEISEAFAAARGLALPSQLRRAIRASGRELHEEFLQLLPRRPAPVRVQRWSARRRPGRQCPVRGHLVRRFPRRLRHDRAAPGDPAGSGRPEPGRPGPGHRRVRLARGVGGRAGPALRRPAAAELGWCGDRTGST